MNCVETWHKWWGGYHTADHNTLYFNARNLSICFELKHSFLILAQKVTGLTQCAKQDSSSAHSVAWRAGYNIPSNFILSPEINGKTQWVSMPLAPMIYVIKEYTNIINIQVNISAHFTRQILNGLHCLAVDIPQECQISFSDVVVP